MPRYTFENIETGEVKNFDMKMAEYDDFVVANPSLRRLYSANPQLDPVRIGVTRTSSAWKDLLGNVAKEHRNLFSGGTNVNVF